MEQDATWYGGRPRPRRHCVTVLDGDPASPTPMERAIADPPLFGIICLTVVDHLNGIDSKIFFKISIDIGYRAVPLAATDAPLSQF